MEQHAHAASKLRAAKALSSAPNLALAALAGGTSVAAVRRNIFAHMARKPPSSHSADNDDEGQPEPEPFVGLNSVGTSGPAPAPPQYPPLPRPAPPPLPTERIVALID